MAPTKSRDPELADALAAARRAYAAAGDDWPALGLWLDLLLIEDGKRPKFFKRDDLQAERIFRRIEARLGRAEGVRVQRRWRRALERRRAKKSPGW